MKKNQRLYNPDGTFKCWTDTEEIDRLVLLGVIEVVVDCRQPGKKLGHKFTGYKPSDKKSDLSITFRDMEKNIGVTKGTEYNPREIERVREKIKIWPFVGDSKAVNVRAGGRVQQPEGPRTRLENLQPCYVTFA